MTITSYDRPSSVEAAVTGLAAHGGGGCYVAGGTDLLPLIRAGIATPRHLVDLREASLPTGIQLAADGHLVIGAAATMSDVASDPIVRERYPALAQALLASASAQVRNAASIGGNLLQRTRCGYFRDTSFACNKRNPGSGCPAQEGNNRRHAILGGSSVCVAVHASDLAVVLLALKAQLRLRSRGGERHLAVAEFYLDPSDTPWRETALHEGELIVAVEIPDDGGTTASAYVKVRDRASFEFALVSAAAILRIDAGRIITAAVALGGVAPRPWRLSAAEVRLIGQPLADQTVKEAVLAGLAEARPLRANGFKVALARRAAERAVLTAGGVA